MILVRGICEESKSVSAESRAGLFYAKSVIEIQREWSPT